MIVSTKHSRAFGDEINPSGLLKEIPARRGFSISYDGKALLSKIDPVAQGERLAAGVPIKERTLYFCPSPLYGYGLSLLLDKLKANSAVLCVEADEKLFEISRKALGENTGAFTLVHALTAESLCVFLRKTWGERVFHRVEEIRLSGGWQLFPALYEDLLQALRREIALEWGNIITLIHLGRLYAKNLIRNLPLLPESESIETLNFFSSPALVLGAGPSLDSILEELTALWGGKIPEPAQRRFKIICVDTCLPALNERQILPDLAVILESQHWNLRDFTGLRGLEIDTALDLSALPASAQVLNGKRYFFTTQWTGLALFKRLEEAGLLPEAFAPMGSVGLSAVAIALRICKGPVITGGIDFSYTLDAYHARSTPGHLNLQTGQNRFRSIINAGSAFRDRTFPTLSKTGKSVRSDPVMNNYRNIFEQEFGAIVRLLDINGAGLPLGIKTISPRETFTVLNEAGKASQPAFRPQADVPSRSRQREKIAAFIRLEMETLKTIKDMLTGLLPPDTARLEELLDTADYLWAHFPECAGAGGNRPPGTDLGFLKRVRTEIDPFQKLWEMSLRLLF
jgi:hypothetical protein